MEAQLLHDNRFEAGPPCAAPDLKRPGMSSFCLPLLLYRRVIPLCTAG